MNELEKHFVEEAYLTAKLENDTEGGLLFPFLVTKKWKVNKVIRAIVIPARKNTTACFACLGYKKNYNGIFFSCTPELENEEKDIVEVIYYRVKANIQHIRVITSEGEEEWKIKINPDTAALEQFFEEHEAVYVSKKEHLHDDPEIPF